MAESFLGDMVLTDDMDPLSFPDPPCFSKGIGISLGSDAKKPAAGAPAGNGQRQEADCFGMGSFGDVFDKTVFMFVILGGAMVI